MSAGTLSSAPLSAISERIRKGVARSIERRDHDRSLTDPRVAQEHYAARARTTESGGQDCPFCR